MAYADIRVEFIEYGDGSTLAYVKTWGLHYEGLTAEQLDEAIQNMDKSRNVRAALSDDVLTALRGLVHE